MSSKVYRRRGRWWLYYRADGQEVRLSVARALGRIPAAVTQADAERLLKAKLREVEQGEHLPPRVMRLTLADVLNAYLAQCRLRGVASLRRITTYVEALRREYGKLRATAITPEWLRGYGQRQLDAGLAPASVASGALAVLRAAFRQAETDGTFTRRLRFPVIAVSNARQGFVEPDEAERIFAELDQPFADAARFSYFAARRINEVLSLTWEQVSRETREVRWPKVKNGRPLTLPLTGGLWEVIERRWSARAVGMWLSAYVFHASPRGPLSYSAYRLRFVEAASRAGVPQIRPHDFRRSGVRNMIRAGVSQSVARSISGHQSDAMFHRYDITSTDDQRAALARTQTYHRTRARTTARTNADDATQGLEKG